MAAARNAIAARASWAQTWSRTAIVAAALLATSSGLSYAPGSSASALAAAVRPPEPPAAAPPDWQPLIARSDMAFSAAPAAVIGAGLMPIAANGFLGVEPGPLRVPGVFGGLYLAGVFNGANFTTPSHRAELPRTTALSLAACAGCSAQGVAVDFRRALVLNRTLVDTPECPSSVVEVAVYAHRALRELLVLEVAA